MKIKMAEIKAIEEPLSKLMTKELNIKIAYRLSKFLKVVGVELQELENNRIRLVRKYGNKVENKDNDPKKKNNKGEVEFKITPKNEQKFIDEYNELLRLEIEVDFNPILLSELEGIQITTIDMMRLENIIIIDEKEKKAQKAKK